MAIHILFGSEFNKPDLERGSLIAFNTCRKINIYHKIMVNISDFHPRCYGKRNIETLHFYFK
jgi:hypothetical protein